MEEINSAELPVFSLKQAHASEIGVLFLMRCRAAWRPKLAKLCHVPRLQIEVLARPKPIGILPSMRLDD